MSDMNGDKIFEEVKSIITDQLGVDGEKVSSTTSFDELNADSLDVVELIMAFEEEFDLEIPDEDAEKIGSVGEVVQYIKDRQ